MVNSDVGGLEDLLNFHILGMSSFQLTFIFFRGVQTTNQSKKKDTTTFRWQAIAAVREGNDVRGSQGGVCWWYGLILGGS